MSAAFMFFVGTHQPSDARHFAAACVSLNRLERRTKPMRLRRGLLDSGAFTKVNKFGGYPEEPEVHAGKVFRLWQAGVVRPLAVVAEDYMCEPFVLKRTGLTIAEHQLLTVERFDRLVAELKRLFGGTIPFRVMPVLQGQSAADYVSHLAMYGDRITNRMWVGVGSVCKRQGNVAVIEDLLAAIKGVRPDLRLHGFRREADGPQEHQGAAPPVQRRQHGLELRGRTRGAEAARGLGQGTRPPGDARGGTPDPRRAWGRLAKRERLAHGRSLPRQDQRPADRAGTTHALCLGGSMTELSDYKRLVSEPQTKAFRSRIAVLEAALKPFADTIGAFVALSAREGYPLADDDIVALSHGFGHLEGGDLTFGDFRRAVEALGAGRIALGDQP